MKLQAVILAAGEGTRLKSKKSKVLHQICGRTLLDHVIHAIPETDIKPIVIVGKNKDQVEAYYNDTVETALQAERRGTGHAVMCAQDKISEMGADAVLIVAGDMPLFTSDTLRKLCTPVLNNEADACILTAVLDDPTGYGRIIRDTDGNIIDIVEQKDANEEQLKIKETNVSGYCVKTDALLFALSKLDCNNAQNEYYITDIVKHLSNGGYKVVSYITDTPEECAGINDRIQLEIASNAMQSRINRSHMINGVTLIDSANTYIDADVTIGRDTVIYPGVNLKGNTVIGEDCIIYPGSYIENSEIADNVTVRSTYMFDARVDSGSTVGPFAYIRPNSVIGKNTRIGDFVEIKNSNVGDGTKVSHLSYIGDGDVGENVNVGCGTVFSNYDGKKKYRTTVGNDVFIGCNTNLIAPVNIADDVYIAAGSTITDDVESEALAIARARQINKPDWVNKRKEKNK